MTFHGAIDGTIEVGIPHQETNRFWMFPTNYIEWEESLKANFENHESAQMYVDSLGFGTGQIVVCFGPEGLDRKERNEGNVFGMAITPRVARLMALALNQAADQVEAHEA